VEWWFALVFLATTVLVGWLGSQGWASSTIQEEPYERYWKNGQLKVKGTRKNGKGHGPWMWYFENGQQSRKVTFHETNHAWGTVLIPVTVYAGVMLLVAVGLPPLALVLVAAAAGAGCAWPVGNEGVLDGPYEIYRENGQLVLKGTLKDGRRCGEWFAEGETVTYDPC
jgi:hypothetical protein